MFRLIQLKKKKYKLKTEKKKPEIKLPIKFNKKNWKSCSKFKKNIKDDVEKHICKGNDEIRKIWETADEKNCKLKDEDEKFLENWQKDNEKAVKEVDLLLCLLFKIVIEFEKSNNYIISILNPYIMYKNYYTSEDIMDFNISFKTLNNGQNITITPNFDKYSINNKILEGYRNTIEITKNEERILLTKPSNNEKYLFTQMEIFTPDISVEYVFCNSIYNSKLGETGEIEASSKNSFKNNLYRRNKSIFWWKGSK